MPSIEMYTKDWCPYCTRAKRLLSEKGQEWTEIDIEAETARRDEMLERSSGQRTVPQIFIDGQHVGGFDELQALEDKGELLRASAVLEQLDDHKADVLTRSRHEETLSCRRVARCDRVEGRFRGWRPPAKAHRRGQLTLAGRERQTKRFRRGPHELEAAPRPHGT